MSSGHRFSKEGKVIGFSQRVKKGKEKFCMGMLYTENWKLPHCFPSLLPASSQTKSLPTTFHDDQNYSNIVLLLDSSSIVSLVMHLYEVVMKYLLDCYFSMSQYNSSELLMDK